MKKISLSIVALASTVLFSACSGPSLDLNLDEFATCLNEAGITIYIQDGCGHCITQERMFGDSFDKLNVVNCSYEQNKCAAIPGTPTWVLPNAEQLVGVQSFEELAEVSGCELPTE